MKATCHKIINWKKQPNYSNLSVKEQTPLEELQSRDNIAITENVA